MMLYNIELRDKINININTDNIVLNCTICNSFNCNILLDTIYYSIKHNSNISINTDEFPTDFGFYNWKLFRYHKEDQIKSSTINNGTALLIPPNLRIRGAEIYINGNSYGIKTEFIENWKLIIIPKDKSYYITPVSQGILYFFRAEIYL